MGAGFRSDGDLIHLALPFAPCGEHIRWLDARQTGGEPILRIDADMSGE